MGHHAELVGPQGNHVIHDFEYADTTAREAATGLVTGDLKKLALQLDNNSFWILTAITPTWQRVGNEAGAGDVVGPGAATDEALARYDGATGQLLQNSNALLDDAGALTLVGGITSETRKVSTNPAIIIEIFNAADLDALASGGVITVPAGTEMDLRIKAQAITTANRFLMEAGSLLTLHGNRLSTITYSGTGTFFTATTGALRVLEMRLTASSTGTLFDLISPVRLGVAVEFDRCSITGWNLGTIDQGFILFTFLSFVDYTAGLLAKRIANMITTAVRFDQTSGTPISDSLFKIDTDNPLAVINLHFSFGNFPAGDFYVKIDPAFDQAAFLNIDSSIVRGDVFDTAGITGVFTAVADASFGATPITSVSDSGGRARFNFTPGPTLFVGQTVDLSAFITNTAYNATGRIVATGAGFFELGFIPFGTDETGSFLGNSVTITETTTAASDGLGLTIETAGASDYDGGAVVYNKLANSFEISRAFTSTKAGTWSAAGLDHTDPRVISTSNPGQDESHYIASAFVNGNTTANGSITNGVFTDIVFGTAGSALVASSNMERWKLIDDVLGIFEYTGNEPFDGDLFFTFTAVSVGGAVEFQWKWLHDIGAGFVDLPDPVESVNDVGSVSQNTSFVAPLTAVKGDQIKPQITRTGGGSAITTTHASISAK